MAAGQQNKKTGAIIQARMKSVRLPGKILLPLPFDSGEPLIAHIIKRAKNIKGIDEVILATSADKENDILKEIAQKYNVNFFQGDEENVLARFNDAARNWNLDVIIRFTADNPCIDVDIISELLLKHSSGNFDISFTSGLPVGTNIEIFNSESLYRSYKEANTPDEFEHVTPFMYKNDFFSKQKINYFENDNFGSLRLTVDYPTDYALMSMIFSSLYNTNNYFGISEIKELYRKKPWLKGINQNNYQKKVYRDINEEVESAINELERLEFNNVAELLRKSVNI